MATRTYRLPADYNPGLGDFTFETSIEGYHYLKIGGLTQQDLDLVESLLPIGNVGFFQGEREIANTRILARYDTAAGLRVETIPDLQVGSMYAIYVPPSTFGEGGISLGEVEQIAEEAAEELDDTIIVTGPGITYSSVGAQTQIIKTYTVGSSPPTQFVAEWYANKQDYINGQQQDAAAAPTNVSFDPTTPATTRGQHQVVVSFTPRVGSGRNNPALLKFEVN